ncbi:MAG: ABC transporter substrate-binding protein [Bacteroidales bacterium]|nr:ABC transporter substrate-binding protein [Bacteroidales bacterium]
MKRLLSILMAVAMVTACSSDRDHILKVYNWSDYIDEDLIGEFEEWYEEQTGEPVKIVYQTFDINETMLSKIEKGQEDYDVVCPSDYIIERMVRSDMVIPIDTDFGDTPNYIEGSLSPYMTSCLKALNTGDKDATKYAVSFMWGTTGFIYNPKYVDPEDLRTWDVLRNPKYAGKIFVKDAARDIYSQVIQYLKYDDIVSGKVTREELLTTPSQENVDLVENYLKQIRGQVAGYEADFGKDQMTQERGWISLNWSGDASWAIDEAADVGVVLDYIVPDEGATVWFDGWVIPKFARNVKAASYFINFMCKPENAIRNSEEIGYVSACGTPEILEHFRDESYDPINLTYFFGEGADSVCINPVLYPAQDVIERCALEHDWGEDSQMLIEMWSRVKGSNASVMTYIIIGALFVALVVGAILSRTKKRSRGRRRKRRR